jgi:succinoglycan biosynthesis transport protein ExoP
VTFAEYFTILQRRWRVWVAGLVLGLLGGAGVIATAEILYTATATSFVTVAEQVDSSGQGEIFQGSQFAVQRVRSYAPLVKSPDVLGPVIDELDLDVTERQLAKRVSVASAPETVLLDVSVEDADPVRAARTADAVSEQLGTVIEDLETARVGGPSNVRVSLAHPADVPATPSSPRVLLDLLLGGVAGLALGLVGAVLRHHLDTRVKTPDGVRALTEMSPLGATVNERSAAKRPLVTLDWRSSSAERYRTVRTALKFATVDRTVRHFVVTSSAAGEGKTSVACNLAISWAQSGASVCLVEADLRRPGVSRFLGIDGSLGLSDVVVGECTLDAVLVPWNQGLLSVLPAGSLPPDPAALLGSSAMGSLVETLRDRFDVVIYDSPPLLAVTDGVVLGHQTDGVVLVIRAYATRPEHVRSSMERLRSARVDLLGTVLTRERARRGKHEYSSELTRDRLELSPRPGELSVDRGRGTAAPAAEQVTPRTNGVASPRVTVDSGGGGCDR